MDWEKVEKWVSIGANVLGMFGIGKGSNQSGDMQQYMMWQQEQEAARRKSINTMIAVIGGGILVLAVVLIFVFKK